MKASVKFSLIALALCALVALPVQAQGSMSPWDIEGDVDGDGVVGPTDVQHVVNQALGLSDEGPAAVNRNRRQFIVASPRASLALKPGGSADAAAACDTIGAAFNFPRQNCRMLVRTNTAVRFRFDKNTEGVWYEDACGLLSTALTVEYVAIPEEGIADPTDETLVWSLIGEDQAGNEGCGPAIGTAAIAVPYIVTQVGEYLVRATVVTRAVPQSELADGAEACGTDTDTSLVYIHVRVIDGVPTAEQLQWYSDGLAGPIQNEFGQLWRHGMDDSEE
jgi:hypothetical protein